LSAWDKPPALTGLVWATAAVAIATLIRLGAEPLLGDRYVFGTFYVAVAWVSWYAGVVPGALAALSGVLLADHFFFRSDPGSALGHHPDTFELVGYWLIAGTLITLITRLQARERSLRSAVQSERDLRVRLSSVEAATGTFEWDWDISADRLLTSKGAESVLGASPLSPDDLASAAAAAARMLAPDSESIRYAVRIQVPDRSAPTWLEIRGAVHRGPDGTAVRASGIAIDVSERQRALEAAAAAEQRFKVALAANEMLVWACDANWNYTWVYNPAIGFRSEDIVGRPLATLLPRETSADYANALERVWQGGRGERLPVQWEHQGKTRHYVATIEPITDSTGRVAGLIGALVDVTTIRGVEAAARHSAENLARTFEASPDGLVVSRVTDGLILEANSSFLRLFGLQREHVEGRRFCDLSPLDELHRALQAQQIDRGQRLRDFEVTLRSPTGRRWSVLLCVEPLEGTPTGSVLNIVRDVTALREAEAFGRVNRDWLQLATEGAQIGTWTTDLEAGLTECDARNRAIFELPDEPRYLSNALWSARIHPDDIEAVNALWHRAAQTHAPCEMTCRIVRNDGSVRWIETRALFHPADGHRPPRAYGVSMDVTEKPRWPTNFGIHSRRSAMPVDCYAQQRRLE
jgi:PAS domain S-box-containing protein